MFSILQQYLFSRKPKQPPPEQEIKFIEREASPTDSPQKWVEHVYGTNYQDHLKKIEEFEENLSSFEQFTPLPHLENVGPMVTLDQRTKLFSELEQTSWDGLMLHFKHNVLGNNLLSLNHKLHLGIRDPELDPEHFADEKGEYVLGAQSNIGPLELIGKLSTSQTELATQARIAHGPVLLRVCNVFSPDQWVKNLSAEMIFKLYNGCFHAYTQGNPGNYTHNISYSQPITKGLSAAFGYTFTPMEGIYTSYMVRHLDRRNNATIIKFKNGANTSTSISYIRNIGDKVDLGSELSLSTKNGQLNTNLKFGYSIVNNLCQVQSSFDLNQRLFLSVKYAYNDKLTWLGKVKIDYDKSVYSVGLGLSVNLD